MLGRVTAILLFVVVYQSEINHKVHFTAEAVLASMGFFVSTASRSL